MIRRYLPTLFAFPVALVAAACSDPPPTPAAMGMSLELSQPISSELMGVDIGGRTCNARGTGAWTYIIGQPAPNKTIEDGKNGVSVDCTVRGDGSFVASGEGYDQNTKEQLSFNVSGRITDPKSTTVNMGQLAFYTPFTSRLETESTQYTGCTFGPATVLKKGAVLTDVNCPIIVDPHDSSTGCRAHGTLAFEYCKTGEEQN